MKISFHVSFSESHAIAELSSLPPDSVEEYNRDFNVGIYPANVMSTLYFNRLYSKDKNTGLGSKLMRNVVNFLDNHNFSVILEVNAYHSFDADRLVKFYEKFGFLVKFKSEGGNLALMVRQHSIGDNVDEVAPF